MFTIIFMILAIYISGQFVQGASIPVAISLIALYIINGFTTGWELGKQRESIMDAVDTAIAEATGYKKSEEFRKQLPAMVKEIEAKNK